MQSSKEKARSFFDKVEHARGIFHYNDIPLLLEYFAEAFDEYEAKLKIATEALEKYAEGNFIYTRRNRGEIEVDSTASCELAIQALEALKGDV